MKILVASDSFKESLSSSEIANAIEEGMKNEDKDIEVRKMSIADGGEGTLEALVDALDGEKIAHRVTGPLGQEIEAVYGLSKDKEIAILEVAQVVGLVLVDRARRNPLHTTTLGIGELIKEILNQGIKKLIVGLGGSSTNDAGIGMMQALGVKFLDKTGKEIYPSGENLINIAHIDLSQLDTRILDIEVIIASDVKNPLLGETGATKVFGPQKGADSKIIETLEQGMTHYASQLENILGKDVKSIPGAGAAGGLGMAFDTFFNATMKSGIDLILDSYNTEEIIEEIDLVITGEGRIDYQTQYGKAPMGITMVAKKHNKKIVGIAGQLGVGSESMLDVGIDRLYCITPEGVELEQAIKDTHKNIVNICKKIVQDYKTV